MSIFVDIEKRLGDFHLQVQLEAENETLALLGASGCGKSMTLRCIAGIEKPDRGTIIVDGETLFDSEQRINMSPQARRTGLLFQSYALFPHMTVLQNIMAGSRRKPRGPERRTSVSEILKNFGLSALADHYPHQLSGGQQQRVALARMLVSDPSILLLDEPFSALDAHLRFQLEQDLREVIRRFGKTVLLVSHDRDEVFRMADHIAIMDHGKIEALGPKRLLFQSPGTRHAAILTGCKNICDAEILDAYHIKAVQWNLILELDQPVEQIDAIGIRMHDLVLGNGKNTFVCQVQEEIENPFSYTILLRPDGASTCIAWELDKVRWQELRSQTIAISLPAESIILLKE